MNSLRREVMKSLSLIFALFVINFICLSGYAHTDCLPPLNGKITMVYFANGVGVLPEDAALATDKLEDTYKASLDSLRDQETDYADEQYIFCELYNNSQSKVTDFAQALLQVGVLHGLDGANLTGYELGQFAAYDFSEAEINQQIIFGVQTEDTTLASTIALLKPAIAESTVEFQATTLEAAIQDRADDEEQFLGMLLADLMAGRRVIVIAHSQGNLFTNDVIRKIKNDYSSYSESIATIGLATPELIALSEGEYWTALDDRVINALRLIRVVEPGNINNDLAITVDRSWTNHYFDVDYLQAGLPSRAKLDEEIVRLSTELPYPMVDEPPPPPPEVPVEYQTFTEGNPGIDGDGLTVATTTLSSTKYSLTLDPKPLIGNPDGTTITVFTEQPSHQAYAQIFFEFGYLGSECLVLVEDNDNEYGLTNNAEAAYYSLTGLSHITIGVNELINTVGFTITNPTGCDGAVVANMFLNRIQFQSFYLTPVLIDAVTVDVGKVRR